MTCSSRRLRACGGTGYTGAALTMIWPGGSLTSMPKRPDDSHMYGDYGGVDWSTWDGPEWEKLVRRARDKNLRELDDASDDRLKECVDERKLKRAAEKRGVTPEEVLAVIRDSRLYRAEFIKDPKRQNLYEKIAAAAIQSMPGVEEFKHHGTNETGLVGGVPTDRRAVRGDRAGAAKTIDFSWACGEFEYYASHKYTKESGGAQDNQHNDLLAFIEEANKNCDPKRRFVAIADGEYYDPGGARGNVKKIDVLRQKADCRKGVYAVRINELVDLMNGVSRGGGQACFV